MALLGKDWKLNILHVFHMILAYSIILDVVIISFLCFFSFLFNIKVLWALRWIGCIISLVFLFIFIIMFSYLKHYHFLASVADCQPANTLSKTLHTSFFTLTLGLKGWVYLLIWLFVRVTGLLKWNESSFLSSTMYDYRRKLSHWKTKVIPFSL